jgi:hypothetical protein
VKLTEAEEDDLHSLQQLGMQSSEDHPTCDVALKNCGVQSIYQVLAKDLTRLEEKEEVAEHKATFMDPLKGMEAARKYILQFDTKNSIVVTCNEVENKLYRLRAQGEKIRLTG